MNPYELRLKSIEDNLNKNLALQSEWEEKLTVSNDPTERANCQRQIEYYRQRVEELTQNWEGVNEKLLEYNQKVAAQVLTTTATPAARPLEKHYADLVDLLLQGQVIPVLGVGVNQIDRPPATSWQPGQYPPNLEEITAYLIENFKYPSDRPVDLAQVSQFAAVVRSPGRLYERLRMVLGVEYPPGSVHRFLAGLPKLLRAKVREPRYPIILSTSYDNLLEYAFDAEKESYDLLSYVSDGEYRNRFIHLPYGGTEWIPINDPSRYREIKLEARPVIIKVHGVLDRLATGRDALVITEDDFINYMARTEISRLLPASLMVELQRQGLLFLGYNLADRNSRVIINRLWEQRRNPYDSWAVEFSPSELVTSFWQKLGVKLVQAELRTYIQELTEYLEALPGKAER